MGTPIHPNRPLLRHPSCPCMPRDQLLGGRIDFRGKPYVESGTAAHIVGRVWPALPNRNSEKRRIVAFCPHTRGGVNGQTCKVPNIWPTTALRRVIVDSTGPFSRQ